MSAVDAAPAAAAADVQMSHDGEEHKEGEGNGASAAAASAAASSTPAAPSVMDVPPNQTLYVNNLNEKIKKVSGRETSRQGCASSLTHSTERTQRRRCLILLCLFSVYCSILFLCAG
jgi:hypothetical protein